MRADESDAAAAAFAAADDDNGLLQIIAAGQLCLLPGHLMIMLLSFGLGFLSLQLDEWILLQFNASQCQGRWDDDQCTSSSLGVKDSGQISILDCSSRCCLSLSSHSHTLLTLLEVATAAAPLDGFGQA